jgi:hypothetical protein
MDNKRPTEERVSRLEAQVGGLADSVENLAEEMRRGFDRLGS